MVHDIGDHVRYIRNICTAYKTDLNIRLCSFVSEREVLMKVHNRGVEGLEVVWS